MESQLSPTITPRDRLSFTLFIAISLHAAVILGITFGWQIEKNPAPTIKITLANHDDNEAPKKADFAAQTNQLGSGNKEKVLEKTTTEEAIFHSTQFNPVTAHIQQSRQTATSQTSVVTTTASADNTASYISPVPETEKIEFAGVTKQKIFDLSKEIASLEARLDSEQQREANHPRIRRLTSVSARKTVDAYYLNAWTRKVESVGNINYPGEARRQDLYGELRLLVTITPDGALREVSILESSGHKILDDAALHIVRMAAPFAPFPEEMRRSTDVLEIIRTWQFRKNRYTSS
ncbi:MAG: energy transducer TonB [Pseudomonadales bacterium]|nr:energy transducer TonB [Pseudomonadales bacterium]